MLTQGNPFAASKCPSSAWRFYSRQVLHNSPTEKNCGVRSVQVRSLIALKQLFRNKTDTAVNYINWISLRAENKIGALEVFLA